jgi:hypothetical protein
MSIIRLEIIGIYENLCYYVVVAQYHDIAMAIGAQRQFYAIRAFCGKVWP